MVMHRFWRGKVHCEFNGRFDWGGRHARWRKGRSSTLAPAVLEHLSRTRLSPLCSCTAASKFLERPPLWTLRANRHRTGPPTTFLLTRVLYALHLRSKQNFVNLLPVPSWSRKSGSPFVCFAVKVNSPTITSSPNRFIAWTPISTTAKNFIPVLCFDGPEKKGGRHKVRLMARAITAAVKYSINWFPAPTPWYKSGDRNLSSSSFWTEKIHNVNKGKHSDEEKPHLEFTMWRTYRSKSWLWCRGWYRNFFNFIRRSKRCISRCKKNWNRGCCNYRIISPGSVFRGRCESTRVL